VVEQGIYAVSREGAPSTVNFFDLASRRVTRLGAFDNSLAWANAGCAVSPDERWILFEALDQTVSDTKLVENFR